MENNVLRWMCPPQLLTPDERINNVLTILQDLRISPMDLLLVTLGPQIEYQAYKDSFYHGNTHAVSRFLNVVQAEKRGNEKLMTWVRSRALKIVLDEIAKEMDALQILRMSIKDITPEFFIEFTLRTAITDVLEQYSPWLRHILLTAAQTIRAAKENTKKKVEHACSVIHCQLANLRSSNNQKCQFPIGYFFYSAGISRKVVDMTSRLGLTPSYTTVHRGHTILADGQMRRAKIAARHPDGHMTGWDNTQICTSVHVEQRGLAPAKVQTGTTSIIYPLRNSSPNAIRLKPILERQQQCDMITFADLRPTRSQARDIERQMLLQIIYILFTNEEGFGYVDQTDPLLMARSNRPPPSGYKTQEFVMRTTTIDEGSTEGNIEVANDQYFVQLDFEKHDLDDCAVLAIHDQSTNARIRAAQILRKKDLNAVHRMSCFQCAIGWFHAQLNFIWALLHIHRGTGEQIGSLQFFIVLLGKVRLGKEKPDFNTLRSLATQVLSGNILTYWKSETGLSLSDFAATKPSATQLLKHAQNIYNTWVSDTALRTAAGIPDEGAGDDAKRNTVLLNRDFLVFFVLSSAISSGDFGRVEILMGTLTMMFAGAGCKNYTTELLHFIQNLKHVWTPEFANVVRDNSLINMSGRDGHYHGVDKNAETNINFQKDFLAAKANHGTFAMLADLAPNIPLYRPLKRELSVVLGAPWQGTTHTVPDFSKVIKRVADKVEDVDLNVFEAGRGTIKSTVDILAKGSGMLSGKGMDSFRKRWRLWAEGGVAFEEEDDDIAMLRRGTNTVEDSNNDN